jgi:hypothetical protein
MQGFDMLRAYRVFSLLRPARPRHPIVHALLALFAVCAFIVLLVFGLTVAAIVMMVGTVLRALGLSRPIAVVSGNRPQARADAPAAENGSIHGDIIAGDIIDGEFSVVDKSIPNGTH